MSEHQTFQRVAAAIDGVPVMRKHQGSTVFDHLVRQNAQAVLEIGTAYGAGTAYMAAAMEVTGGKVTSLDTVQAQYEPSASSVLDRAGVSAYAELVRNPDSDYNWWLSERVLERSDEAGNCTPMFDFCYLDGSHEFTMDGLAVVLVERLLKPGGWLLLDDLDWSYARGTTAEWLDTSKFSEAQMTTPHVGRVFESVVRPHRSFTEFRVEGTQWGWAKKAPGQERRLTMTVDEPLRAKIYRRARQKLSR